MRTLRRTNEHSEGFSMRSQKPKSKAESRRSGGKFSKKSNRLNVSGFRPTRNIPYTAKSASLLRKFLSRTRKLGQLSSWTIDLDVFRVIFMCPYVSKIFWRISPTYGGLHFLWFCLKSGCTTCARVRVWLDDPGRLRRDAKKPTSRCNVLWDVKDGRRASEWATIERKKK